MENNCKESKKITNRDPFAYYTGLSVDVEIKDDEWKKYLTNNFRWGRIERIGVLGNATSKGKPAIQILGRTADGQPVVLETTWALMHSAIKVLESRWEDDGTTANDEERDRGSEL